MTVKKLLKQIRKIPLVYWTLAIVLILNTIFNPKVLTLKGLNNLSIQVVPTVFTVMAQTCAILIGEINLAVDGIINLTNVVMALTMERLGFLSVILVLAIGIISGFLIGIVVTKLHVNSFIATLSFSMMLNGISLLLMSKPGGYVSPDFGRMIRGSGLGVPNLLILVLIVLIVWKLFKLSRHGMYLYAAGGNEYSAYASGIHVDREKITAYMISGFLVAIASLTISGKTMTGDATVGTFYPMNSIAGSQRDA